MQRVDTAPASPRSDRRPRRVLRHMGLSLLGLLAGAMTASAGACFVEVVQAPGFRFSCAEQSDCRSGEECLQGLCQRTCTAATYAEDCEAFGTYATCFNGVCAEACRVGDDACSPPTECVPLDPTAEPEAGEIVIGICGTPCDAADPETCAEGELCIAGVCFQTCDPEAVPSECPESSACVEGICIPTSGGGGF